MKNTLLALSLGALLSVCTAGAFGQGMAVNTTGAAANSSAILDASSTTQGMLIPRMTAAQLAAISSPATGLLVYQTDGTAGFYFYNGSSWVSLNTPGGSPSSGDLTGSYPNPTISSSGSTGDNIITAVNASGGGLSGTKLATNSVSVNAMSATGTRNSTTYLRGDNTWATVSGGSGTVTSVSSGVLTTGTTAFTDTLFHSIIVNPTTTPSIFYTFNNAAAATVLTNSVTGSPAQPVYGKVVPQALYATSGTPSSTTFYRGDGQWQTPSSSASYIFCGTIAETGSASLFFGFPFSSGSNATNTFGTPMPTAITITNWYVTGTVKGTGGVANITTVTLYKNGISVMTAGFTANASDPVGTQYNTNTSGSVSVSAGDLLTVGYSQTNSAGPICNIGMSFLAN
jgi:hypothetical protein